MKDSKLGKDASQLRLPFCHDEKYGFVDGQGAVIVAPIYTWVGDYKEDRALVTMGSYPDEKKGFVDGLGHPVGAELYKSAASFSSGLAAASVEQTCTTGYLDLQGNWAIEQRFTSMNDFDGDNALAREANGPFGIIDRSGAWVVEPRWPDAGGHSGQLVVVHDGRKWGAVDLFGETTIPFKWVELGWPGDGLIPARRGKKWGYLDAQGKTAIALQYQELLSFRNGYGAFMLGGKWGCLDLNGQVVVEPEWDMARPEGDAGICTILRDKLWGIMDLKNGRVVKPQYKLPPRFQGGLACVEQHIIDTSGEVVAQVDLKQLEEKLAEAAAGLLVAPKGKPSPKYSGRYPFLYYGRRPKDWVYPCRYDILFLSPPDQQAKDDLSRVIELCCAHGPVGCSEQWLWSGCCASFSLSCRVMCEEKLVADNRFFDGAEELFRAIHEVWPLAEVVLKNVEEEGTEDYWDQWSRQKKKRPTKHPAGKWRIEENFEQVRLQTRNAALSTWVDAFNRDQPCGLQLQECSAGATGGSLSANDAGLLAVLEKQSLQTVDGRLYLLQGETKKEVTQGVCLGFSSTGEVEMRYLDACFVSSDLAVACSDGHVELLSSVADEKKGLLHQLEVPSAGSLAVNDEGTLVTLCPAHESREADCTQVFAIEQSRLRLLTELAIAVDGIYKQEGELRISSGGRLFSVVDTNLKNRS